MDGTKHGVPWSPEASSSLEVVRPKLRRSPTVRVYATDVKSPYTVACIPTCYHATRILDIPTHVFGAGGGAAGEFHLCKKHNNTGTRPVPRFHRLGFGNGCDQSINRLSYGRVVRLVALRGDGCELALIREQNPYRLSAVEKGKEVHDDTRNGCDRRGRRRCGEKSRK